MRSMKRTLGLFLLLLVTVVFVRAYKVGALDPCGEVEERCARVSMSAANLDGATACAAVGFSTILRPRTYWVCIDLLTYLSEEGVR